MFDIWNGEVINTYVYSWNYTRRYSRYKSVEIQHSLSIDQTIANLDHFDWFFIEDMNGF